MKPQCGGPPSKFAFNFNLRHYSEEGAARAVATDFLELLEKIDYNKYFESMKSVPVTGSKVGRCRLTLL